MGVDQMTHGQPRADHIDESLARKSIGAGIVAVALCITAASAPVPLWEAFLIGAATWLGLHMVAGLKIKCSYPDW
jgi:hypothetical protein